MAADPHLEILRSRQNIHKACPLARTRKAIQNVRQRRFRKTQVQPAASPQTKIAPASTHAAAQRGMNHQQTAAKATRPRLPMAAPKASTAGRVHAALFSVQAFCCFLCRSCFSSNVALAGKIAGNARKSPPTPGPHFLAITPAITVMRPWQRNERRTHATWFP